MDKLRILLVVDTTSLSTSGGKVISYLHRLLETNGHSIKIVDLSQTPCTTGFYDNMTLYFFPQRFSSFFSFLNYFYIVRFKRDYQSLLRSFNPQVVHFASFDSGKPLWYIKVSRLKGRRIFLQPWIYDFYCARKYGFRNGIECDLCLRNSFGSALKNKCISFLRIFELFRRAKLKDAVKYADYFLSSTLSMDSKLITYGVEKDRILRLPVPFEGVSFEGSNVDGDYFIFFGQNLESKGLHFIIKFFNKHPQYKLKIFTLGHIDFEYNQNIAVYTDISWGNGLVNEIRNSMAIVLPSLWESTGEYALFESMSFKKPIILFNVGIHNELFKETKSVHIVNLLDENDFLLAIDKVYSDSNYRYKLSVKAFDQIQSQINDFYPRLESIYYIE